jgi:hypothetical protein
MPFPRITMEQLALRAELVKLLEKADKPSGILILNLLFHARFFAFVPRKIFQSCISALLMVFAAL